MRRILVQQLGIAGNGVERRADFVADADDEAALGQVGGVGGFLRALQFGVGAGVRLYLIDQHARSEEHTSELQSLMRISYAVFCLKKNKNPQIVTRIVTATDHEYNKNI